MCTQFKSYRKFFSCDDLQYLYKYKCLINKFKFIFLEMYVLGLATCLPIKLTF